MQREQLSLDRPLAEALIALLFTELHDTLDVRPEFTRECLDLELLSISFTEKWYLRLVGNVGIILCVIPKPWLLLVPTKRFEEIYLLFSK